MLAKICKWEQGSFQERSHLAMATTFARQQCFSRSACRSVLSSQSSRVAQEQAQQASVRAVLWRGSPLSLVHPACSPSSLHRSLRAARVLECGAARIA
ncbi:hypothetical protein WJX81_001982 [Elliptochloris bilobata]|uniref:Uncharacterized protein n=1 Tax=Elliptochloris bilobata TaxID=381761 RepID=A0AAW1RIP2_9CHLO